MCFQQLKMCLLLTLCLLLFTGCSAKGVEVSAAGAAANSAETDAGNADAAGGSDLAYILDKGTLVIGITIFEPMNYYEGDTLAGFDTEFAEAVCAELGVTPEFVVINWDTKETELAAKTIDCIWNGLTISDARR